MCVHEWGEGIAARAVAGMGGWGWGWGGGGDWDGTFQLFLPSGVDGAWRSGSNSGYVMSHSLRGAWGAAKSDQKSVTGAMIAPPKTKRGKGWIYTKRGSTHSHREKLKRIQPTEDVCELWGHSPRTWRPLPVFGIIPYTAQAGSTMLVFSVASSVTIPRL